MDDPLVEALLEQQRRQMTHDAAPWPTWSDAAGAIDQSMNLQPGTVAGAYRAWKDWRDTNAQQTLSNPRLLAEALGGAPLGRLGGLAGVINTGKIGPFGRILQAEPNDAWADLVEALRRQQGGEVQGALSHPEIGSIDVPWGKEGTGRSDGYGLSKILKFHPDAVDDLPATIQQMDVTSRSPNRVRLDSPDHGAGVRLTWDDAAKTWLMTAYKKGSAAPR